MYLSAPYITVFDLFVNPGITRWYKLNSLRVIGNLLCGLYGRYRVSGETVSTLISQVPEVVQSKIPTFFICPIHVASINVLNFYPNCIFG